MEVSIGNFLLYRKERPIRKKPPGGSQGLPRRCEGTVSEGEMLPVAALRIYRKNVSCKVSLLSGRTAGSARREEDTAAERKELLVTACRRQSIRCYRMLLCNRILYYIERTRKITQN